MKGGRVEGEGWGSGGGFRALGYMKLVGLVHVRIEGRGPNNTVAAKAHNVGLKQKNLPPSVSSPFWIPESSSSGLGWFVYVRGPVMVTFAGGSQPI